MAPLSKGSKDRSFGTLGLTDLDGLQELRNVLHQQAARRRIRRRSRGRRPPRAPASIHCLTKPQIQQEMNERLVRQRGSTNEPLTHLLLDLGLLDKVASLQAPCPLTRTHRSPGCPLARPPKSRLWLAPGGQITLRVSQDICLFDHGQKRGFRNPSTTAKARLPQPFRHGKNEASASLPPRTTRSRKTYQPNSGTDNRPTLNATTDMPIDPTSPTHAPGA